MSIVSCLTLNIEDRMVTGIPGGHDVGRAEPGALIGANAETDNEDRWLVGARRNETTPLETETVPSTPGWPAR
jgi:hypothetical protein